MKLALVVQRYGAKINGGAELHARYIAELLARHHKVEALTTCASNYITWANEYPAGTESLRGVTIRRFPVSRERDPRQFGHHSQHVFEHKHSLQDELAWLESEGPTSPALIDYIRAHADDYDYWIFFSYRYYLAYHGARAVPHKAILVPTAERDSSIGLSLFGPLFRGVRAVMYNSHEERAMIRAATHNDHVPGVIVGIGSDVPRATLPERFRKKYDVQGPFVVYVGRIDENKGCRELFTFFTGYRPGLGQRLELVLLGNSILPIPKHPNIRHLGYVSDQDKFDAIAAADALMMPSYYESLSMVALEAWALGRPVLANGRCDVLRGQCIRSRAGLYYDNFHEFCETLFTLTTHRALNDSLGDNGRQFYDQHYAWPVVERKYLDMIKRLAQEDASKRTPAGMEPLPGWLMRRRRTLPAAASMLATLPTGAALNDGPSGEPSTPIDAESASTARRYSSDRGDRGDRSDRGDRDGRGDRAASTHRDGDRHARSTSGATVSAGRTASSREGERGERREGDRREARHGRDRREGRDARPSREGRDAARESRSSQEGREPREARENREPREGRESREGREPREGREGREQRRGRDGRERRGDSGSSSSQPRSGQNSSGQNSSESGQPSGNGSPAPPKDSSSGSRREGSAGARRSRGRGRQGGPRGGRS